MTNNETDSSRQRNLLLILGGLLVVSLGVILGLLFAGGSDDPSSGDTTLPSSTTGSEPTLPTTPTTAAPVATTSTVPVTTTSTTLPADIGADLALPAVADASIESDSPEERLGSDDDLTAKTVGPDVERSLMRFEVQGIPDDAIISQATLRLFVFDGGGTPALSAVDGSWDESTVTWSNAPAVGEMIGPIPDVPEESFVRVNVTSHIEGNGLVEFFLLNEGENEYAVGSRESGDGPVLEIILGDGEAILTGAGDIAGCDSDGDEATASLLDQVVDEEEDTLVFTLGDNAYESGTPAEFADCYHPSWGRHREITRPSSGAREYSTPGATGYFAYFGAVAGDPAQGYYSYDYGGWHVVVLNSNCAEVGGCDLGSPQVDWLEEDLVSSQSMCTLAYWHHPVFGSTLDGMNNELVPFWEILYAAEAEVVLNGDHHFYERFAGQNPSGGVDENGLVQFTVGTGGHSLSEIGVAAPNSEVRFNQSFGVLVLTLTPDGYSWEFRTAPASEVVDSGDASCH